MYRDVLPQKLKQPLSPYCDCAGLQCWCVAPWCTAEGMRSRARRIIWSMRHMLQRRARLSPLCSCQVCPKPSSGPRAVCVTELRCGPEH